MGLTLETSLPAIAVFLQGLFSFFSPCVLPLVPLYVGYLAGGTQTVDAEGNPHYPRKKVMINTLFFVLGVSFAFFVLGLGFSTAGQFLKGNRMLFAKIGGILVVLFGLYQLGVFGGGFLQREHRLPFRLDKLAMNPLVALVLGFTFSFAWTPCVGPALASVLLMASSASSASAGYLLIGVYTLGFVLPFLAVGLFTGQLLELFKKHRNVMRYAVKAGGVLMVLMGIMMFTGWMNNLTGYLSSFGAAAPPPAASSAAPAPPASNSSSGGSTPAPASPSTDAPPALPAFDFTLTDQFGTTHTLADYKGKVVFLNFWATWCGYCVEEMPEIQALYEEYGLNEKDVAILGVANPKTADSPNNADVSEEEVKKFLADRSFTYPVLMDPTGEMFQNYQVTAFPTTFMIDTEGNIFGYVAGAISKEQMVSIIQQTIDAAP